jgi:C-3',4' desaturase CrtD
MFDVAVIGSGIAGLTAAALLQRDGAQVLVCESHDKPGGCAGYFEAGQFSFPTGATVALGFEPSGLHARIFKYLNQECAAAPLDGLQVLLPDREVFVARDRARWKRERAKLRASTCGRSQQAQERFWAAQEIIANAGWKMLSGCPSLPLQQGRDIARNLRLIHPSLLAAAPGTLLPMQALLRALKLEGSQHRALRAFIELQLGITVQSSPERAPLTNACAGMDLFQHGGWHPRGGMGAIAGALVQSFEREGGQARFCNEVDQITPKFWRGRVHHYEMVACSGAVARARKLILNTTLPNAARLVAWPRENFQHLRKHAGRGGEQWGAVTLYIGVRDGEEWGDGARHWQVLADYGAKIGEGRDAFLSLSARDDGAAPDGWRALNISTHTFLGEWRGLSLAEYKARKLEWRDRLLEVAARAIPDLEARRSFVIAGAPRSWRYYTLRDEGGVGGSKLEVRNANLWAPPSRTGLENCWIVGDSNFPGQGTVACALSGLNAWRDITGHEV